MAAFDLLCPTCHSRIGDIAEETIGFEQGSLGTDDNGLPVPRWTDDPLRTGPLGFSGPEFIGADRVKGVHIRELQQVRTLEEIQVGIAGEFLTDFSEIDGNNVRVLHIVELRESVEKILSVIGSELSTYFSVDPNQDPVEPGPNDEAKDEWTDIDRGRPYIHKDGTVIGTFRLPDSVNQEDVTNSPTLPPNTPLRAIHIEDLRHTVPGALFFEYYSVSDVGFEIESTLPEFPGLVFTRTAIFPTDLQIRVKAETEQIQTLLDAEPPAKQLHGPVNFDAIEENQGWWRLMTFQKLNIPIERTYPNQACLDSFPSITEISVEFTNSTEAKLEILNGVTLPGEPVPTVKALANKIFKMTSLASSLAEGNFAALEPQLFSCRTPTTTGNSFSIIGLEGNVAPVEPKGNIVFVSSLLDPNGGISASGNTLRELHDDVVFPGLSKPSFDITDLNLFKWHEDIKVTIDEELEDYAHGDTDDLEGSGVCAGLTEIEDPDIAGTFILEMQLRFDRSVTTLPLDPSSPFTIANTQTNNLNIGIFFLENQAALDIIVNSFLPEFQDSVTQTEDGYRFGGLGFNQSINFGPSTGDFTLQPSLIVLLDDLDAPLGGPNYEIDFKRMLNAWVKVMPVLTSTFVDSEISGIGDEEAFQSLYISQELAASTAEDETPLVATIASFKDIKFFLLTNYKIQLFQFGSGSICFRNILGRIRHGNIKVENSVTGFRLENRSVE
ncbi:MAG: hypothetical protein E2O29_01915 [Deltaproteobacteria bacterium]|nr:MAG: hypothetical protein E2O29_01915 [Deltaproteobacteria bacterium]